MLSHPLLYLFLTSFSHFPSFCSVPIQAGVITGAIIGVVLGLLILVVAIYYLMRFLVARRVFSLSVRSVWECMLPQACPEPLPGFDKHTHIHTCILTKILLKSPQVSKSPLIQTHTFNKAKAHTFPSHGTYTHIFAKAWTPAPFSSVVKLKSLTYG